MAQANPEPVNGQEAMKHQKMLPWANYQPLGNVPAEWLANQKPVYGDKLRDCSGGGVNWLTQEEIDAIGEEHAEALARDEFWLKTFFALVLIGIGYMFFDAVMAFLEAP